MHIYIYIFFSFAASSFVEYSTSIANQTADEPFNSWSQRLTERGSRRLHSDERCRRRFRLMRMTLRVLGKSRRKGGAREPGIKEGKERRREKEREARADRHKEKKGQIYVVY